MTKLPDAGAPDVLYLLDLSGYVFRAYHAIAPLTSPRGEPTHAVYGTVQMLSRLVNERRPAYLAVAMDSKGRTFRDELDARYKAHRPPPPPDLSQQMERARELCEAYAIPIYQEEGLEADDLIASFVPLALREGLRVVIASADKDLMQLVEGERVMMWDAMRDRVYGPPEVEAKWGVPPAQVRDLLALVGDTSDNVPGVPGVGEKTAAELLRAFGDIEGIYGHLAEVKRAKIRENLETHRADLDLSRVLVTLKSDAEVHLDLAALRYGGADVERLRGLFTELGFHRMLKTLPTPVETVVSSPSRVVGSLSELAALAARAEETGSLAFELSLTSAEPMTAALVGLSLSPARGEAAYAPVGHVYLGAPAQLPEAGALEVLQGLFANPSVRKVTHDAKRAEVFLLRHALALRGVGEDAMLASYLLDPEEQHTLEALSERELGRPLPPPPGASARGRGKPTGPEDVPIHAAAEVACAHADALLALGERYDKRLASEGLAGLLAELELPLSSILARMEHTGVLVDPASLVSLGGHMNAELAALEARAHEAAGCHFNLGSPKQLESVLFDSFGLKSTRKTKTGRSTDAEVLEALSDDHPLPGIVLEHRIIAKLKGTYVDALPRLVHPTTGRIHTRWSQAVAATGRISSQDPNLQNIPIRTALGRSIRKAFPAPPGHVLLSADYSQIELRILAHLSADAVLCEAFREGDDVHVRTAMEIFGVPRDGVTDEMRRQSKTINFGVIYGMGETALAKRLGISRGEAARFIDTYFARYEGVRTFLSRTLDEARRTGAVHTLLGRRRLVPDLASTDRMRRAQAERIAQNTPIQGTAADLLKVAMVRLGGASLPGGARMVLTVHDELVFEVPEAHAEEAAREVKTAMESVLALQVPLVVEVGWGATWADAH